MGRSFCVLILLSLIIQIHSMPISNITKIEELTYRLPNNTKPENYDVILTTNIHKEIFEFNGLVEITLTATENSNDIVIHARQLNNFKITLKCNDILIPTTFTQDVDREFLIINVKSGLTKDEKYILTVAYEGILREDMGGFYRSSYNDKNGKKIYLATTQFESTNARHAFPCYDEPGIKATFKISIQHGEIYTAASNMPLDGLPTKNIDGTVTTKFQVTPVMSTYLIAFVVSNFESTTKTSTSGLIQRVYSRPGTNDEQKFALDTGVLALDKLQKYFNVDYSLPKMDQFAIPDFAAGAMENWGLVTYREEYLLYKNGKSTVGTETSIANIISHEYAHQWFGNLVSPTFWTYIWLNEGFASLYSYVGTDLVYPEWKVMEHFIVAEYQRAIAVDDKKSPRPMTHYVEKPKEIQGVFDGVSYSKASCVLRMIQHVLTEETFKKALNHYLKKMSYKAAVEDDLIDSFIYAAKEDNTVNENVNLKHFIISWTQQGGAPVLTVNRDYAEGTATISQKPLTGLSEDIPNDSRLWYIPFNIITKEAPDFKNTKPDNYLAKVKTVTVNPSVTHSLGKNDWLLLNKQQAFYYRVNYDENNWFLLADALIENVDAIHTYNRAQLIDDAVNLALGKKLPLKVVFHLLRYIKNEKDFAPWMSANAAFKTFNKYLYGDEKYDLFKHFVHDSIKVFFDEIGVADKPNDQHYRKVVRTSIINWACLVGVQTCLDLTNKELNDLVEKDIEIEPNVQTAIYCNGLRKGTQKQFDYLFQRLLNSDDQAERKQIMSSLGCAETSDQVKYFLRTSINTSPEINYRPQERLDILRSVYENGEIGMTETLSFLTESYKEYAKLSEEFTKVNPLLTALNALSNRIVNENQRVQLESLIEKSTPVLSLSASQIDFMRSNMNENLNWIKTHRNELITWLTNYKLETSSATSNAVSTISLVGVLIISLRSLL